MPTIIETLPDLQFRSADALQYLYSELIDLTIEMAEEERKEVQGAKRGVLTRYINSLKTRKRRNLPQDRVRMLAVIYDMILAADGMGLLPGFGFGNKYGDSIAGNPERQSIYNIEPQKGKREDITMSDEIKRSELVNAAKELNELLGLEPPIDVKAKPDVLKEKLTEAAGMLEEGDEISSETEGILKTLKSDGRTDDEDEEEWKESDAAGEEDPPADVDLPTLVKDAKKLADLKALVLAHDEFKKLRKGLDSYQGMSGPRELKPAMLKMLGVEQDAPAPVQKKSGSKKDEDFSKSNKAIVYGRWLGGEKEITTLSNGVTVKESTIKTWVGQWKNGKNLPAIAKQ